MTREEVIKEIEKEIEALKAIKREAYTPQAIAYADELLVDAARMYVSLREDDDIFGSPWEDTHEFQDER